MLPPSQLMHELILRRLVRSRHQNVWGANV
jgi:hypothetical protein